MRTGPHTWLVARPSSCPPKHRCASCHTSEVPAAVAVTPAIEARPAPPQVPNAVAKNTTAPRSKTCAETADCPAPLWKPYCCPANPRSPPRKPQQPNQDYKPTKTTSPKTMHAQQLPQTHTTHKQARPVHRLTRRQGVGAAGTAAGAMGEAAPLPCPAASNSRLRGVRCSSCNAAA